MRPIDDDDLPFMACGDGRGWGRVEARLFRISFSGEHAYEIAVPARYGEACSRASGGAGRGAGRRAPTGWRR